MKQQCLLLGSGFMKAERRLATPFSLPDNLTEWTTLDMNPDAKPNVIFNLDDTERGKKLPFKANYFHEIHAYSLIEHYGRQGDWRGFFTGMRELWRVLVPGGYLLGACPAYDDMWTWGDPGHTRVINRGTLSYLTREHYEQLGKTPSSDYRNFVDPCWWKMVHATDEQIGDCRAFAFGLEKVS